MDAQHFIYPRFTDEETADAQESEPARLEECGCSGPPLKSISSPGAKSQLAGWLVGWFYFFHIHFLKAVTACRASSYVCFQMLFPPKPK